MYKDEERIEKESLSCQIGIVDRIAEQNKKFLDEVISITEELLAGHREINNRALALSTGDDPHLLDISKIDVAIEHGGITSEQQPVIGIIEKRLSIDYQYKTNLSNMLMELKTISSRTYELLMKI